MGLELKKGDSIVFLCDRSGSMDNQDCADGTQTRYDYMREKIEAFVQKAVPVTGTGVSIYFFSAKVDGYRNVTDVAKVDQLYKSHRPGGGTMTHLAFEQAWKEHSEHPDRSTFVICFTDGEPSDPQAVEREIINITNRMKNPEEFRIAILTVGEQSTELAAWLEHIDSSLDGAKFDIISHEKLDDTDFDGAIADLIGSSTTASEATAGHTGGKTTQHIS